MEVDDPPLPGDKHAAEDDDPVRYLIVMRLFLIPPGGCRPMPHFKTKKDSEGYC